MESYKYQVVVPPECDVRNAIPVFETLGRVATLRLVSIEEGENEGSKHCYNKLEDKCNTLSGKFHQGEQTGPKKRLSERVKDNFGCPEISNTKPTGIDSYLSTRKKRKCDDGITVTDEIGIPELNKITSTDVSFQSLGVNLLTKRSIGHDGKNRGNWLKINGCMITEEQAEVLHMHAFDKQREQVNCPHEQGSVSQREQTEALHIVDFSTERTDTMSKNPPSVSVTGDRKWFEMVEALKKYIKNHRNCSVPANFKGNPALPLWVSNLREQYRLWTDSKPSTMTKERIACLEDIGFVWEAHDTFDQKWAARLEELKRYKEENGDCLVPRHYPKNPKLGAWVMNQRTQHSLLRDGKRSSMTTERFLALQSMGFVWSKDDWGDWEAKFSDLREYKREHGDCLVPSKFPTNQQLANWVINQRRFYRMLEQGKASVMTAERIELLPADQFLPEIVESTILHSSVFIVPGGITAVNTEERGGFCGKALCALDEILEY